MATLTAPRYAPLRTGRAPLPPVTRECDGPAFRVIIRLRGTEGPEGIRCGFFAMDKVEGRVRVQEELAQLLDATAYEVQIFRLG